MSDRQPVSGAVKHGNYSRTITTATARIMRLTLCGYACHATMRYTGAARVAVCSRLAEQKGSPRVDYETVLFMVKSDC